jgi:hypothetical protein
MEKKEKKQNPLKIKAEKFKKKQDVAAEQPTQSKSVLPPRVETDESKALTPDKSAAKKAEKNKKRAKKQQAKKEIVRFMPDADKGLSKAQVQERIDAGHVNKGQKKYSKTYRSIFVSNICTFFNLLCLLAALALHWLRQRCSRPCRQSGNKNIKKHLQSQVLF